MRIASEVRRTFAKRTQFFVAKSEDTFNASNQDFASVSLYDRVRDDSAEQKVTKCHVLREEGWFPSENCFHIKKAKIEIHQFSLFFKIDVGNELSSQEVALQVFSPLRIFTTVFGMGTGGFFSLGHQQTFVCCLPIILGFQLVR